MYYIYNTTTGEINRTYTGPAEYVTDQIQTGEAYLEDDIVYDTTQYYISTDTFVNYPNNINQFCYWDGSAWVYQAPEPTIISLVTTVANSQNQYLQLNWDVEELIYVTSGYNWIYEVYENTIDDIGTATLVAVTNTTEYIDTNAAVQTSYFWVRATWFDQTQFGAYTQLITTMGAPILAATTELLLDPTAPLSPIMLVNYSKIYGEQKGRIEASLDVGGPTIPLATSYKMARFIWQSIPGSTAEFAYNSFGGALTTISTSLLGQSNLDPGVGLASYPYQKYITNTSLAVNVNGHYSTGTNLKWHVGTLANSGRDGFYYSCKFGLSTFGTGNRGFIGLSSSTAVPTNTNPLTLTNVIGIGLGSTDSTLYFVCGGSVAASYSTGLTLNTTHAYELSIKASNGLDEGVIICLIDLTSNSGTYLQVIGTQGTDFPGASTALYHRGWVAVNSAGTNPELCISNILIEYCK